jgi:NADPH-dependent 2,4-dienoyl-CoA reductase/sulfur reductase-like enzyme
MRLVVVGGVAAGTKAASRARRLDPEMEITVYQEEPEPAPPRSSPKGTSR